MRVVVGQDPRRRVGLVKMPVLVVRLTEAAVVEARAAVVALAPVVAAAAAAAVVGPPAGLPRGAEELSLELCQGGARVRGRARLLRDESGIMFMA